MRRLDGKPRSDAFSEQRKEAAFKLAQTKREWRRASQAAAWAKLAKLIAQNLPPRDADRETLYEMREQGALRWQVATFSVSPENVPPECLKDVLGLVNEAMPAVQRREPMNQGDAQQIADQLWRRIKAERKQPALPNGKARP